MAKVRAYKIAEELGLDSEEFLKRAREVGIELKSQTVGLDEDEARELRRKLGMPLPGEQRVEKRVGSSVIRRRRKKPEAAPAPAAEPTSASDALAAQQPATPAAPDVATPEKLVAEADTQAAAAIQTGDAQADEIRESLSQGLTPMKTTPAAPVELPEPDVETPAAATARTPSEPAMPPAQAGAAPTRAAPTTGAAPAARSGGDTTERTDAGPRRVRVRREVIQTVNLREQETIARQLRDKAQRRLEERRQIVEQQSRAQAPRRRIGRSAPRKVVATPREVKHALRLSGPVPVAELSRQAGVKIHEILRRARGLGVEVDRDSPVDLETAELLATELGIECTIVRDDPEDRVSAVATDDADLEPRPPVVTVMGHVDHGKTSLLDRIRKTDVVAGEAGGITQHIGAYQVDAGSGEITFLDTPGHAAFTQMRARGAQVTDLAILVVAADDGIMPQTIEAIDHARAAGVPIIVAINKIDKPDANAQRVRQGLLEQSLVPEDLGGDTICVEVSATAGTNVDKLLEMINLQAEILELRARSKGAARGTVVEAELEKGRGAVATVLVGEGTLKRGDCVVAGTAFGKLRALSNDRGEAVKAAGPSTPVQLIGLSSVPEAGDEVAVVKNEREAKAIAEHRMAEARRAAGGETSGTMEADDLFAQMEPAGDKTFTVVLKADVRGTAEAIRTALEDLSTDRVKLKVIRSGVGAITESDVMLASASGANIVGFHVRPETAARKASEREDVEIRTHDVVYDILDGVKAAMSGLLPPKIIESVEGEAEVLELFAIPRGTAAGCAVRDGVVKRANAARVVRNGVTVYAGKLSSLRRHKDDVRDVTAPLECGLTIENYNDVKVGDRIESYSVEERPDTL